MNNALSLDKTAYAQITSDEALKYLEYPERTRLACTDSNFLAKVAEAKLAAVASNNEAEANSFWIVETIASIQCEFRKAFSFMKASRFYNAWCTLEVCEIAARSLLRHYTITKNDAHRIGYIWTMVERWQSLFPYKIFISPELLKKSIKCSICNTNISLRNPCGHKKGGLYNGEQCNHIVTKCDLLWMSLVTNPVQKYSVLFRESKENSAPQDHYDYALVKLVSNRAESPFHEWHETCERRIHSVASLGNFARRNPCPCQSGLRFNRCCSSKSEITIPHRQFTFHMRPIWAIEKARIL